MLHQRSLRKPHLLNLILVFSVPHLWWPSSWTHSSSRSGLSHCLHNTGSGVHLYNNCLSTFWYFVIQLIFLQAYIKATRLIHNTCIHMNVKCCNGDTCTCIWCLRDAFTYVQQRRFCVNPNESFMQQLTVHKCMLGSLWW